MKKEILCVIVVIVLVCVVVAIFSNSKNEETQNIVEQETTEEYGINEEMQRYYEYSEEEGCYIIYDLVMETEIGRAYTKQDAEEAINYDSTSKGQFDTSQDLEE